MQLSFAQVEHILALGQNIREDRRSAFANRLKNYQKAGFPEGINTGRGRAAAYELGHVLQLGLALELNQLGLNPERSIAVIQSDMEAVAMSFSHAAQQGPPEGSFTQPWFLFFDPAGLSDLMTEIRPDRAVWSFQYGGVGTLQENIANWGAGGVSRISIVNVSALLWDIAQGVAFRFENMSPAQVYDQVMVWASPIIHNEPYYAGNPEA